GVSIKPGAQAPGSDQKTNVGARDSGRQFVNFTLSPVSTGSGRISWTDPGARAPGFMLTPASQAKRFDGFRLLSFVTSATMGYHPNDERRTQNQNPRTAGKAWSNHCWGSE